MLQPIKIIIPKGLTPCFALQFWRGGLVIVLSLLVGVSHAAEYSVDGELKVTSQYDDNVRLVPDNETSLYGATVRPVLRAAIKEQDWDISATVDLRFNKYDRSSYDSNDQFINLDMNKRLENHTFGLEAEVVRDTTLTSEVNSSGRISNAQRRESYSIAPTWRYLANESNYLTTGGSYEAVDYKEDEIFTPYEYFSGYGLWTHILTQSLTLNTQMVFSRYIPDDRGPFTIGTPFPFQASYGNETDTYSLQTGGSYQYTEAISFSALVGSSYTDARYDIQDKPESYFGGAVVADCFFYESNFPGFLPSTCALEDYTETSITGDVGVDWAGELNSLSINYSLSDQPSSQGYVIRAQRLDVDWEYKPSEKSTYGISMVAGKNEAVDSDVSDLDPSNANREFVTTDFDYSYRINRNWWMDFRTRLRWQDQEISSDDAQAIGVRLGVTYRPTKIFM